MATPAGQKVTLFAALVAPDSEGLLRWIKKETDAMALLERERLVPLVYWRLKKSKLAQFLPLKIRESFAEQSRRLARAELLRETALKGLLSGMAELRPLLLKGADFSRRLYPPLTRPTSDIDLYLPRHRVVEFARIARELGWYLTDRGRRAWRLWKTWNHLKWTKDYQVVELHYELVAPGRYVGIDDLAEESETIWLGDCSATVPSKENALLFALAHLGGKHLFESHLLWAYDIYLLANQVDWERLLDKARSVGLLRTVRFTLAWLRRYPGLRERLPGGTALKPGRLLRELLGVTGRWNRLRARLLALYLVDQPARAFVYLLEYLRTVLLR